VKVTTFTTSGRKVTDKKAPFTASFATKGLPVQIVVRARVVSDRSAQSLSKSVKRC